MKLLVLIHSDVEEKIENLFYKYFNVSIYGNLKNTSSSIGFVTYQSGESNAFIHPASDLHLFEDWKKTALDDFYDLCDNRLPYWGHIMQKDFTNTKVLLEGFAKKNITYSTENTTPNGKYVAWKGEKFWTTNEKNFPFVAIADFKRIISTDTCTITLKKGTIITNKITGNVITI